MPAAAANSGPECTTVIQSSPPASGSSAVSNVSGWPRGSSTAAGSALATAISASVMETSSGCGSNAKRRRASKFGSFVGHGADHQPCPELAHRRKAARQHQMLEGGLAPPRQTIAAEHDAPLEAGAARRRPVETGGGGFRQLAHRHHEVEPAALEPGAVGIGGVDRGGNLDPGYRGAAAGYGELVHHDGAATGGRRLGAGGDRLLVAAADNAVALLDARIEVNLAPFDAAIERHHQTLAGLSRNQWQKSQADNAKKAGNKTHRYALSCWYAQVVLMVNKGTTVARVQRYQRKESAGCSTISAAWQRRPASAATGRRKFACSDRQVSTIQALPP